MLLEINKKLAYNLVEETKIETVCGALYQAQDLELGRTVAVKCVNIQGSSPREKEENYRKALSEVKAMVRIGEAAVNVPTILTVHYDQERSVLYIVMEWISGENLTAHMGCPEQKFLNWMIELCQILEVMERQKLYHKDIKPANVMITREQKLYLIDFNISISTPNLVEGTLHYKAPEMSANSKYAGREKVDMFAVGVMLYEYYTGAVPVRTVDYAKNRQRGPMEWDRFIQPKEKNPEIPEAVNAIILKCMKLDPKQRYARISDLKNELKKAVWELRGAKRKN